MSSLTIPTVTAPLPAMNVHPHGHGHKKDSLDPTATDTDTGSSTAAQIPTGSAQTMFGRLFGAISQLLGAPAVPTASVPGRYVNRPYRVYLFQSCGDPASER